MRTVNYCVCVLAAAALSSTAFGKSGTIVPKKCSVPGKFTASPGITEVCYDKHGLDDKPMLSIRTEKNGKKTDFAFRVEFTRGENHLSSFSGTLFQINDELVRSSDSMEGTLRGSSVNRNVLLKFTTTSESDESNFEFHGVLKPVSEN